MQNICQFEVKFSEDEERLKPVVVYPAPADYHLQVVADYSLALYMANRVNPWWPSIYVLCESAAEVYLDSLKGVIMTGANAAWSISQYHDNGAINAEDTDFDH